MGELAKGTVASFFNMDQTSHQETLNIGKSLRLIKQHLGQAIPHRQNDAERTRYLDYTKTDLKEFIERHGKYEKLAQVIKESIHVMDCLDPKFTQGVIRDIGKMGKDKSNDDLVAVMVTTALDLGEKHLESGKYELALTYAETAAKCPTEDKDGTLMERFKALHYKAQERLGDVVSLENFMAALKKMQASLDTAATPVVPLLTAPSGTVPAPSV